MFVNNLFHAAADTLPSIHQHPFNRELAQGNLPAEKFIYYLQQDAMYLADYSKALAMTAARLQSQSHAKQFLLFSLNAIHAESDLHRSFLAERAPLPVEQSPACFMYTAYLYKMAATAAVEEAVASLLPCFWVYREVGKIIFRDHAAENNPYAQWIQFYNSEQFDQSVTAAISVTNEVSAEASDSLREKMLFAFMKATQLEWVFWDSAYRQEQWLV